MNTIHKHLLTVFLAAGIIIAAVMLVRHKQPLQRPAHPASTQTSQTRADSEHDVSNPNTTAPVEHHDKANRIVPRMAVSDNVLMLIGNSGDGLNHTRRTALGKLGQNISLSDRKAIYDFLADPTKPDMLTPMQYHAIKNDIVNVLRKQNFFPAELPEVLIGVYSDRRQTMVMRDYALQHLGMCYTKSSQKRHIAHTFLDAASTQTNTLSGTALLAMHRIVRDNLDGQSHRNGLNTISLSVAADTTYDFRSRCVALEICGCNQQSNILPCVRELAVDKSIPFLQRKAIATLGVLGTQADLQLLQNLKQQNDSLLDRIIIHAEENILTGDHGV